MKMFVVVYVDYLDHRITTTFKQAGHNSFIKEHDLTGEYKPLEPMLKEPDATGGLRSLLIPASDEKIPHLLDIVRNLKKQLPTAGIGAFTFPLEEFVV